MKMKQEKGIAKQNVFQMELFIGPRKKGVPYGAINFEQTKNGCHSILKRKLLGSKLP